MNNMKGLRRLLAGLPLLALVVGACEMQLLNSIVQDVQTAKAAGAPLIQSTAPAANATEVEPGTTMTATFAGALDAASVSTATFLLAAGTTQIAGTVTYEAALNQVVFTPSAPLSVLTAYSATLTTGITSAGGIPLQADYSWSFTTRAAVAPVVAATNPPAAEANAATSTTVWASFEAALDPASVTAASFKLYRGSTTITGVSTYDADLRRAVFTPAAALALSTTYTATLTTEIRSAEGAPMAADYSWSFTTFAANPTEIVVNLSYTGPYTLSTSYPIYLVFMPNPLTIADPDGGFAGSVYAVKKTSQGSAVVSVSSLPPSESGMWALQILHDLNGNYEVLGNSDAIDVSAFYVANGATNVSANSSDAMLGVDHPTDTTWVITFTPAALVEPGQAYTVEFQDPPAVTADAAEPDGDFATAAVVTTMNVALTRTLDWGETDIFKFVPPLTDVYRVVVADNPYDPDNLSALSLPFTVQLSILRLDPGSDQVGHIDTDYGNDGTNYGLVDATLVAGYTHYFVVRGVQNYDAGDYKLKVIPAPATADAYENDDLPLDPGTAPLLLGPDGKQVRTIEKNDADYLTFTLPVSGGLAANVAYAFYITKPGGSVREDLRFRVDLAIYYDEANPGSGGTGYGQIVDTPFPAVLVTNHPQVHETGGTKLYLTVRNESPSSGYFQSTGGYEIALRAGPDGQDYDLNSGATSAPPRTVGQRDNAWNEPMVVGPPIDLPGEMKSIWPAGDVDWYEIWWDVTQYTNGLTFTYVAPTNGADDLLVMAELYAGNGTDAPSAFYTYDYGGGPSAFTVNPGWVTRPGYLYVKLSKSGYEVNKSAGAYRIDITATP